MLLFYQLLLTLACPEGCSLLACLVSHLLFPVPRETGPVEGVTRALWLLLELMQ